MTSPIQKDFERLPEAVRWALERADGFLDLRLPVRARAELDTVPDLHHPSLPYQVARLRLATVEKRWSDARDAAESINLALPADPGFWIQRAFATRRAESIEAARTVLLKAQAYFPAEPVIPYNLGCYACVEGDFDEARRYLEKAFALDGAYRDLALRDADLAPLWPELDPDG